MDFHGFSPDFNGFRLVLDRSSRVPHLRHLRQLLQKPRLQAVAPVLQLADLRLQHHLLLRELQRHLRLPRVAHFSSLEVVALQCYSP